MYSNVNKYKQQKNVQDWKVGTKKKRALISLCQIRP